MVRRAQWSVLFSLLVLPFTLNALTFPLFPNQDVVGQVRQIHVDKGRYLSDISRQYEMGYYEMIEANPGINRHSQLPVDQPVNIPAEFVLPNVPRNGIVINLPELRLYYFDNIAQTVKTFPIAIGRYNWMTPTLETTVIEKKENPDWFVPESIKEASAKKGIILPDVVPAGPENPLGQYALRLGQRNYLIHGTNAPNSIGKRASSGCMRMYPENIKTLFDAVPVGTPVRIINEYFKLGWKDNVLYLEVHEPLQELAEPERVQIQTINDEVQKVSQERSIRIDWNAVDQAIEQKRGIPVPISQRVSYTTSSWTDDESTDSLLFKTEPNYQEQPN